MGCGNDLSLGRDPQGKEVRLSSDKRSTHLYVCGSTGTGKSKFLEHLIRQDILNWRQSECGLLLIDPHGSIYDSLIRWLSLQPLKRPIIPIDLRSEEWVVAYNMLSERVGGDPGVTQFNEVMRFHFPIRPPTPKYRKRCKVSLAASCTPTPYVTRYRGNRGSFRKEQIQKTL